MYIRITSTQAEGQGYRIFHFSWNENAETFENNSRISLWIGDFGPYFCNIVKQ